MDPALGLLLELPSIASGMQRVLQLSTNTHLSRRRRAEKSSRKKKGPTSSTTPPLAAYVHVSDVADTHIASLAKGFKAGKTVKAKITGWRALDGIATATMRPSILAKPSLRRADIHPGMVLQGKVVSASAKGALLDVADGVRGFVPPMHMGELAASDGSVRKSTLARFAPDAVLPVRVLSVGSGGKIRLTCKKTLVASKLPIVASLEVCTLQ